MYLHCIILSSFANFVEWNGRMKIVRITPRFRSRFRWCDSQTVTCHTYILQNALSCELLFHLKNKYSPWCGEREVSRGRHREWHSDRISSDPGSGDSAETAETPTTVTMWTMGHHLQPHLHCARVIVLGIGTCCCLLEFPSHAPSVFRLSRLATLSRSSKAVILLCPLIILIG